MTIIVHTASKFTGKPNAKGWYVIARYSGKRKTFHFNTEAEANTAAKYLREELNVLGKITSHPGRKKRIPTFKHYSAKSL